MKNSINFAKLFVLAMLMMFVVACAKKETATATPAEGEVTSEAVVTTVAPADVVVEETPAASTTEAPAAE